MWTALWKLASSLLNKLKSMRQKWTKCGLLSTTSPNSIGYGGPSTIIPGSLWLSVLGRVSISTWMSCRVFLRLMTSILSTQTQTTPIKHILRKAMLLQEKETRNALSASICPCVPGAADSFARASGFQNPSDALHRCWAGDQCLVFWQGFNRICCLNLTDILSHHRKKSC